MKKGFKKALKIVGITLASLLLVLLILPFALKGKVGDIIKSEGNKMLNAQFDFEKLDISLIRHFPSISVSLQDFYLRGNGVFEKDTLAKANEVTATVNLFSLFGSGGYEISKVFIEDTEVHAIVLKDGQVNWDIMKESATEEEATTDEEPSSVRIKLEDLSIEDLTLIYDDREADLYAEVKDLEAQCSGDFGSERTLLKLEAKTPGLTYRMNGIPFINKVAVSTKMDIDADFENKMFVLKDNTLTFNAISANLDGWVKQIEKGWDMDLRLNSNKVGFKEILSLIPGIYTKDFKELKTDGEVGFTAEAKGQCLEEGTVPQFKVILDVKNGMFRYPSLPGGVEGINIGVAVQNPGGTLDATTIDVHPCNFVMAGNPFGLTAEIRTPMSDMDFKVAAKGKLDLGKIKDVYPMEEMQLNGKVQADMNLSGRLSYIEKERYELMKADGMITLNDMALKLTDLPMIDIQRSTFSFSPRYLKLSETTINIGKNDLTFDSQFENYLAYAFHGKTLKGTLNVKSNYLNLNDFISNTTASATEVPAEGAPQDEATEALPAKTVEPADAQEAASGLHIPGNIDFRMQTHLNKVMLDKMNFDHIDGLLVIKDQKVDMQNLSLNTMGGKVVANGAYATPTGGTATLSGSFALNELDFKQTYQELDMVQQLAPIFEGLKGTYSGNIQIDSKLTEQMDVDLQSVKGSGSLSTKDMSLSGVKFIDQVATIVNQPSLKDIKVRDLQLDFTIDNGRVTTQPFDLKMGNYTMNLSGSTGLDQTIDYKGKITLPASTSGKIRLSTVDMSIKGSFSEPKVSIDMASIAKNIAGQLLDNISGKDTDQSEEGTESSKKKNVLDKALDLFKKKK